MLRGREVLSGFQQATTTGVLICTGHPNCDAGHAALLAGLQQLNTPFIGPTETISLSQRGNLGEFISLHIAKAGAFRTLEKFARNALQPLSGISGDGIDLTYVYFEQHRCQSERRPRWFGLDRQRSQPQSVCRRELFCSDFGPIKAEANNSRYGIAKKPHRRQSLRALSHDADFLVSGLHDTWRFARLFYWTLC
jgi:hypothetical protein